ncbi:TonB-dependent receptor [Nitratireductor aquimarinus]|uniref:TonB-dependent receptor domain-containing protein n=1 Tax=Nitratireductor aquimarinus TaxID=889300 RepID=UPI0029353A51|nr:TonB-dependent receptor [Nitratireductor aquimarinus]MDV2967508.1 TonB-dependent receptor [Nitratireductor aquimarinus]
MTYSFFDAVPRSPARAGLRGAVSSSGRLALAFLGCVALPVEGALAQAENQKVTLLDTLVVTATGFEQSVVDAPASITVVPREALEKGVYRDLTDALRHVQGVAVTGSPGREDISIRGLPGSYTLILVDGKRQNTRESRSNGNSGFEQSFLPPVSAIERIEVVRGPMSALYGSDAMGGVINVITRRVADAWTGTVSADGTLQQHTDHGDAGNASFYASGPVMRDMLGLQIWGRGLLRGEDRIMGGLPEKKDLDLTGRLTFTPNEDHELVLDAGRTRLLRTHTEDRTSTRRDNYDRLDRRHWSLSHTGRWDWTTSEVSLSQEWAERTRFMRDEETGQYAEDPRSPLVRNTVFDVKTTTPLDFHGAHTLVLGGQYLDALLTDQNPGRRTGLDEKFGVSQWALFAEDEWWITPDFALTGGIRMDNHGIYGAQFSPRAYAVWHATPQLTLKGGVSTGFKAPVIRAIAPGYAYVTGGRGCSYGPDGTCGVIIGNPDLEAEKSTSIEIGGLWDSLGGVRLGATYFRNDFKDKISNAMIYKPDGSNARWDEDPNYRLWRFFNIGRAITQGVELTGEWDVRDDLILRGSYTYTHSRQKTGEYAGFPLMRTPQHMASLRADWTTPVEGLSAWGEVSYHGSEVNAGLRIGSKGKPILSSDGSKVLARKYDAYTTVDFGANYALNDNVTLKAAVYNVFDKRIDVGDINTVVEGRRVWVGMTSTF